MLQMEFKWSVQLLRIVFSQPNFSMKMSMGMVHNGKSSPTVENCLPPPRHRQGRLRFPPTPSFTPTRCFSRVSPSLELLLAQSLRGSLRGLIVSRRKKGLHFVKDKKVGEGPDAGVPRESIYRRGPVNVMTFVPNHHQADFNKFFNGIQFLLFSKAIFSDPVEVRLCLNHCFINFQPFWFCAVLDFFTREFWITFVVICERFPVCESPICEAWNPVSHHA